MNTSVKINAYGWIRTITLGVCLTLSGCMVLPETYYEPLTDGETSPVGCGGGPSNILTTQITEGVSVTLRVHEPNFVGVQFNVYANHQLKVLNPEVDLLDRDGSLFAKQSFTHMTYQVADQYGYRHLRQRPTQMMEGTTRVEDLPFGNERLLPKHYWVSLDDAGLDSAVLPDYIQIQLPELEIDGKRIKPKPVQFEKTTWVFLYSFNC